MEMQDVTAVGRGAFRKDRHVAPCVEYPGDFRIDDPGMTPAAAAQEHRFISCREPADEGPVTDFGLGDEGGWGDGVDGEDVDPRDVVGYQHAAGGDGLAPDFEADAQEP